MKYFKKESLISLSENDNNHLYKTFKKLTKTDKQEIISLNNRNKSTTMSINYNNNSSLKTSFNFNESNSYSRNLSVKSIITKAKEDYQENNKAFSLNYKKPSINDNIKKFKEEINSFNNGTFGGGVMNTEASYDKGNKDLMFTKRICVNKYYKIIRKEEFLNKSLIKAKERYKLQIPNLNKLKNITSFTDKQKYQPYFQIKRTNDDYVSNLNTICFNSNDLTSISYNKNNNLSKKQQLYSLNYNKDDFHMDSFYKSFLKKGLLPQRRNEIEILYKPYLESLNRNTSYNGFLKKK